MCWYPLNQGLKHEEGTVEVVLTLGMLLYSKLTNFKSRAVFLESHYFNLQSTAYLGLKCRLLDVLWVRSWLDFLISPCNVKSQWLWLSHAWLHSSLCSNKLWTHADTLRVFFHPLSLQQLLKFASGNNFLWDEPLGREVGCAKLTCMALLIRAESGVVDSLGFLMHVCSVLSRWLVLKL